METKINQTIIDHLTGRRRPSKKKQKKQKLAGAINRKADTGLVPGLELIVHISVDYVRGAGVGIGIYQQAKCAATQAVASSSGPEPTAHKIKITNGALERQHADNGRSTDMLALRHAIALARGTVKEKWPRDVRLSAIRFRISSAGGVKRKRSIVPSITEHVERWSGNLDSFASKTKDARYCAETWKTGRLVLDLRAEIEDLLGYPDVAVRVEDDKIGTSAHSAARRTAHQACRQKHDRRRQWAQKERQRMERDEASLAC